MKLINLESKRVMEECKLKARDAGLVFDDESLEYVISNREMVGLSPKVMVPTLYDYWEQDIGVIKGKGEYQLYPSNPFETVINTRPAISFYNDNNPQWLNVMIYYHVLGHIDFFQNNGFFQHTWGDDFLGESLADKRLIAGERAKHGRWVDYIIEFTKGIDNLVNYHGSLSQSTAVGETKLPDRLDYYFNIFLPEVKDVSQNDSMKEVEKYNAINTKSPEMSSSLFFSEVKGKYPEFDSFFTEYLEEKKDQVPLDLVEFVIKNSPFLNIKENEWMKGVMQVVRNTSLYFGPQRRTKIFNEGWASYWHDRLFREDDHIKGHEIDYSIMNAKVTSLQRVGLNPYAIGVRLVEHMKDLGDQGRISTEFRNLQGLKERRNFDLKLGEGDPFISKARERLDDFSLINTFVNQDFVDKYDLFVVGKRQNPQRGTIEYYVKSRKGEDYKQMLIDQLYHPPDVSFKVLNGTKNLLMLDHHYEGKPLIEEMIPNTLVGLEFLWGGPVGLRTKRMKGDKSSVYLYETNGKRKITKKKIGGS